MNQQLTDGFHVTFYALVLYRLGMHGSASGRKVGLDLGDTSGRTVWWNLAADMVANARGLRV
jgi:hypothetical protein